MRSKTIPAYCLISQLSHVYIGTEAGNVSCVQAFFRNVIAIYFYKLLLAY